MRRFGLLAMAAPLVMRFIRSRRARANTPY